MRLDAPWGAGSQSRKNEVTQFGRLDPRRPMYCVCH
jgi:hypothetical protein